MSHDLKERLAQLEEAKAKREAAHETARLEHRVKELELEDQFEKEIGKRGVEFEIVVSDADGPIVVRRVEEVLYKRFMKAVDSEKGATNEDYYAYVAPGIAHPAKDAFDKIVAARPHVSQRCANAMLTLHGAKQVKDSGKF